MRDSSWLQPRGLGIPDPKNLNSLPSEAQSAAAGAQSLASVAYSAITSAVGAVQSSINNVVPKNCSLGTENYTIAFNDHVDYRSLPLNLTNILPEAFTKILGDQLKKLQAVDNALTQVSSANIQYCLIPGLVLIVFLSLIFFSSMFKLPSYFEARLQALSNQLKGILRVLYCLACCIPFLIPAVVLQILLFKTKHLPDHIKAERGEVSGYCLGALCCVVVMVLLTFFAPFSTSDASYLSNLQGFHILKGTTSTESLASKRKRGESVRGSYI